MGDEIKIEGSRKGTQNETHSSGGFPLTKSIPQYKDNAIENNKIVEKNAKDSEGRELTTEQQEFFKDSVIRDSNGKLMPLYHQTEKEFTVFL